MTESRSIPPPKGLQAGGRRCWKQVTSTYTLRVDEQILLENACRTIDKIAALDDALVGQPLMLAGSRGQEREHPLLSEQRLQRTLLRQYLAQLRLPDVDDGLGSKTNQHRAAAQSRWTKHVQSDGWEYGK